MRVADRTRVPVTKSQDGETLTLALPALNTTEMFVVRTTHACTVRRGAAAGKGKGSSALAEQFGGSLTGEL